MATSVWTVPWSKDPTRDFQASLLKIVTCDLRLPAISRFVSLLILLTISLPGLAQGPLLHEITFANGRITLLGGTDAPDNRWLNEKVLASINNSDTLWLEIPAEDSARGIPSFRKDIYPSIDMHPIAIEQGYGNLRFGDYMDVSMGERSAVESQRLNLNGNWFQPMKPWVAYYYFAYNFWDKQALTLSSPESELVEQFRLLNKPVRSLFTERADFFRFMGSMSDSTQSQFFQSLYNIFDWQRSGEYDARYDWVNGVPTTQFIDAHRSQTPLYYRFMFAQRNHAIAEQLLALMTAGGSHFVYLEINRTLGTDAVQTILASLGATVETR